MDIIFYLAVKKIEQFLVFVLVVVFKFLNKELLECAINAIHRKIEK